MELTSLSNPRVKQWSQLLDKKYRDKQEQFIIEGIHVVKEALVSSAPIRTIVYDQAIGIPIELQGLGLSTIEWIAANESIIRKCTDAQHPQPVFAIVDKLRWESSSLLKLPNALIVVVDGVQDPGNLGTIIRSADAVQASGVFIGRGTVDIYNPKTLRSTMGSIFHLPVIEVDLSELLQDARRDEIQLISTSLQAEQCFYDCDFTKPSWIIVGNEAAGVSTETERWVNEKVIIPMPGQAESLNVAMAATVLLYEALRQRHYTRREA